MVIAENNTTINPSMASGLRGWFKGLLRGATIGGGLGAIAWLALLPVLPAVGPIVMLASMCGFAFLGGSAGFVHDIASDISASRISKAEMSAVASQSYAQGMAQGVALSKQQEHGSPEQESSVYRDRILKQREQLAQQPKTLH